MRVVDRDFAVHRRLPRGLGGESGLESPPLHGR